MKPKSLRVALGVPSTGIWPAEFGLSLLHLVTAFTTHRVGDYDKQEIRVIHTKGSMLPNSRMQIVQIAKKIEADYLLFVDSDHTFPKHMLHALLKHEVPVVAANCVTKVIPAQPTARNKPTAEEPFGAVVYSDEDKHGLEAVWRIGTGVMLLDMRIFARLPVDLFQMQYKPETGMYQGEDWSFCEALERAKIPVCIDHDVSRLVGHIGSFTYTHEYVGEVVNECTD